MKRGPDSFLSTTERGASVGGIINGYPQGYPVLAVGSGTPVERSAAVVPGLTRALRRLARCVASVQFVLLAFPPENKMGVIYDTQNIAIPESGRCHLDDTS